MERFQNLSSQMKNTLDNKEIVKIYGMKGGQEAWFLSSSPSNNFEKRFEKLLFMRNCNELQLLTKLSKHPLMLSKLYSLGG